MNWKIILKDSDNYIKLRYIKGAGQVLGYIMTLQPHSFIELMMNDSLYISCSLILISLYSFVLFDVYYFDFSPSRLVCLLFCQHMDSCIWIEECHLCLELLFFFSFKIIKKKKTPSFNRRKLISFSLSLQKSSELNTSIVILEENHH